jgi:hypothetical protein
MQRAKGQVARLAMMPLMRIALGGLGGGMLGFLYYRFIGCASGACPITSSPVVSSMYGMVVGVLMAWGG